MCLKLKCGFFSAIILLWKNRDLSFEQTFPLEKGVAPH